MTAAPGIPQIFNEQSSTLLFPPLAHSLARIIQLSCVHARVHIGYTPDSKQLARDLLSFRPTLVLAVPRVFEKLYNSAQRQAHSSSAVSGRAFDLAERVAVRWSKALDDDSPTPLVRPQHALLDRLVYTRLRVALGGKVRWSVSGGAPLGARLGHFGGDRPGGLRPFREHDWRDAEPAGAPADRQRRLADSGLYRSHRCRRRDPGEGAFVSAATGTTR